MKFEKGKKYRVNGNINENGNVIEITDIVNSRVHYKTLVGMNLGSEHFDINSNFVNCLEPLKNETIVIYRKGNETIAIDKTTGEKAVAKCSPEDEYSFYTGANLAFYRLICGKTKEQPQREKPKYYNGYVECVKGAPKGTLPLPMTEGKVYEVKDGVLTYDNGGKSLHFKTLDDLQQGVGHNLKEVQLVDRKAEVGEHILIVNNTWGDGLYKSGDIMTVKTGNSNGVFVEEHNIGIYHKEYKVIEGYEPIEKPYNGKVVCIETSNTFLTKGKIYEIKDGRLEYDDGDMSNEYKSFENFSASMVSKFIELVE